MRRDKTDDRAKTSKIPPLPVMQSLVVGALAGGCAKSAIAPLDRLKINFQSTSRRFSFHAMINLARESYSQGGARSFWRGNSATLMRIMPYAAIQFTAHEQLKARFQREENGAPTSLVRFACGSAAGAVSVAATYPLDLARARMALMTSSSPVSSTVSSPVSSVSSSQSHATKYRTIWSTLRAVHAEEGGLIRGCYRGFTPAIAGILPYAGTSFFIFESLKQRRLEQLRHHSATSSDSSSGSPPAGDQKQVKLGDIPAWNLCAMGALAGVSGQTASYPIDIVRRRMQNSPVVVQHNVSSSSTSSSSASPAAFSSSSSEISSASKASPSHSSTTLRSPLHTARHILTSEGVSRGFYKGLSLNYVKGPISSGISFTVFHWLTNQIQRHPGG